MDTKTSWQTTKNRVTTSVRDSGQESMGCDMEAICFLMNGVTVELPHSQLHETSRGRTAPQKSRGQRAAVALPRICQSASG